MLTMPKVIAGAIMAFLAWIVSGQVKVEMLAVHGSYNFGWFVTLSVVIGFLCGYAIVSLGPGGAEHAQALSPVKWRAGGAVGFPKGKAS